MGILKLDHFTIRTPLWVETAAFFEHVIGLVPGPRPGFLFPGYWMYAGDQPLLHIASVQGDPKELQMYLGDKPGGYGSGSLDHVSLRCEGLVQVQARLQSLGIAFRERVIPQIGEHQLFLEDPNGITIEMIFDYVPGSRIVGQSMPHLETEAPHTVSAD
ncbi:VOC family protein [Pseudomonas sp. B21-023]|uniref:VOC family protein n=1 Tax=Pseudomonas sp. B21-023 TaxID=2895477 RepID=UPI00215FFB82|nr:VOC family protein [Pseudomonas sp. B21-023]UVM19180.1 VOC family protein [Pseudomonas sp. B21-023]